MWLKTVGIVAAIAAFLGGCAYAFTHSTEITEWGIERFYDAKSPKGPDRLMQLGSYCMFTMNDHEAIRVYRMMVENHPDHASAAEAQFLIGINLRKIPSLREARPEFQKVVDNYPHSPYADKAKEAVKKIDLVS